MTRVERLRLGFACVPLSTVHSAIVAVLVLKRGATPLTCRLLNSEPRARVESRARLGQELGQELGLRLSLWLGQGWTKPNQRSFV